MREQKMGTALVRIEQSADAMGSTFSIVLYGHDRAGMEEAVRSAFEEVGRIERMLSAYRPDSEWSRVNRLAARQAVKVSPELFRLLSSCLEFSRQSEGAFDISVGPLLRAWGFLGGVPHLPEDAELSAALPGVGFRHLRLAPGAQTVRFDNDGVEIYPGGIGKGYAVDRAVEILRASGFDTALVAGAGSSIYGLGAPPSEPRGWRVEIPDPKNPRQAVETVLLKDMSISTSGNYAKSFWERGRVFSHIMDPRTGYPAEGVALVSVVAPQALDSEAWTKPCFILGREWAAKHRPHGYRVFVCEDQPGGECGWL
jgi:thiamine biosynthesis lipoprotein